MDGVDDARKRTPLAEPDGYREGERWPDVVVYGVGIEEGDRLGSFCTASDRQPSSPKKGTLDDRRGG